MKESELSDEFRNRSNCWADTEEAVQAMDEPTAIQFAKDYAAEVTKTLGIAQGKIGELNNDWTEIVAAKDAEIARLQIEVENLKSYQQSLECDNFHANAHADTFEAEIAALKADKERMREGISDIDIIMDDSNLSISEARHAVFSKVQSLLSPADDTYDSGKFGAPNNLDRPSTECLCSHTIDGRLAKQCDNCRNKPFVPADGDGVGENVPQSLWRLADKIVESQKKLASMTNKEKKSISWSLLHEIWTDEIEEAWDARAGRGIEG